MVNIMPGTIGFLFFLETAGISVRQSAAVYMKSVLMTSYDRADKSDKVFNF